MSKQTERLLRKIMNVDPELKGPIVTAEKLSTVEGNLDRKKFCLYLEALMTTVAPSIIEHERTAREALAKSRAAQDLHGQIERYLTIHKDIELRLKN